MKVCEWCYTEISTPDGGNLCDDCVDDHEESLTQSPYTCFVARKNREAHEAFGLSKVKGACGGVYFE